MNDAVSGVEDSVKRRALIQFRGCLCLAEFRVSARSGLGLVRCPRQHTSSGWTDVHGWLHCLVNDCDFAILTSDYDGFGER